MNIRRCVLIEDSNVPRWENAKRLVTAFGMEFWPPDHDFKTRLLNVDTWLPLICDGGSAILLDLQIGQAGFGAVISQRDVEEILERMQHHPLLPIDYAAFEERLRRIPWNYQIAAWVAKIANTRQIPIKCVTALDTVPVEFLVNTGVEIDMTSLREDELSEFLRGKQNPLERFLLDTAQLDFHEIRDEKAFAILRRFVGLAPQDPLCGLSDYEVRECLKTMGGKDSCFEGGSESLSLLGAYFIFLGAIASITGKHLDNSIINIKDVEYTMRSCKALPLQSRDLAKATVLAMFQMFCNFAVYEESHPEAGELMIRRSCVSKEGIDIELALDARLNWKSNRFPLAEGCAIALKNMLKDLPDAAAGRLCQIIIDYWLKSNIKDKGGFPSGVVFPAGGEFQLLSDGDRTILRLKPCLTS